jgi:hypothetical protein
MNFQTELETLIRARYPILYIISSEEMRVQNVIVEIASETAEKSFRMELQHRHCARPARPSSRTKTATPPPRIR